jgi:small subunit ribosomal protein S20
MPQTASAKKALRSNARRRVVNDRWRRKVREALRQARIVIQAGKKEAALEILTKAESVLDRAAQRNIIHPNKAARKKSQLQHARAKLS